MADDLIPARVDEAIDREIAQRAREHQAAIARIKAAQSYSHDLSLNVALQRPVVMLAHGDSWFDYPLVGNGPMPGRTDVIAQLETMGATPPLIMNVSHHGDSTTNEMSLPKQQRMIVELNNPDNWLDSSKPDAILFSGGGNDIAGDQFCIFLNYAAAGVPGLNKERFGKALGAVEASYLDLFAFRDRYAKGVPIIAHGYDFPVPNGRHPACSGPWLLPSLQYCNWSVEQGTAIVREALAAFNNLLTGLAADPANNFTVVPTQGLLSNADWANELHPTPSGFRTIAEAFLSVLVTMFPNRVASGPIS